MQYVLSMCRVGHVAASSDQSEGWQVHKDQDRRLRRHAQKVWQQVNTRDTCRLRMKNNTISAKAAVECNISPKYSAGCVDD